jgi:hypothetical protein
MRNRNYYLKQIERLQAKLGRINHMVSINQDSRTIKNEIDSTYDILDDIATQIEREPISGHELNNTNRRN